MSDKKFNNLDGFVVTAAVIASLCGLSERRIRQLAGEGIIDKTKSGSYELIPTIKKYILHLRANVEAKKESCSDDENFFKEKALHEKAKREKAELELAIMKNQLHNATDVEMVMSGMLSTFRNRILAIPQKVAPKLIGIRNLAELSEIINIEILETLTELSDYDPVMFAGGEGYGELDEDDQAVPQNT